MLLMNLLSFFIFVALPTFPPVLSHLVHFWLNCTVFLQIC